MTKSTPKRELIPLEPVKVVRRSATNVDQIRADVAARFINHRFDIAPEAERARKRVYTSVRLDGVQLEHFECVGGHLSGIKPDCFEFLFPAKGGLSLNRSGMDAIGAPGSSLVSVGGESCRLKVDTLPGSTMFCLTLSPEFLHAAGAALLGEDFRIDVSRPIDTSRAAGEALSRNVRATYIEMIELEKAGLGSLAIPTYTELLANLSIAALYPDLISAQDAHGAPAKLVERAEDIISARAAEPLTIQEVANELGVTMRALQISFRKHRAYTPLQYLLSRRLVLARERLLAPEARSNVQSVAMSCGFVSMSNFASRYRGTFGEMPSATLERGRRR